MRNDLLIIVGLAGVLLGSGCSERSMYEGNRWSQQVDCRRKPTLQAEQECLARQDMTYDEYQDQLDEAERERQREKERLLQEKLEEESGG